LPCRKDRNIALAVHHTVFNNVSGSIVKYKVDNNPKGNIDGIHPTINIAITKKPYPELIPEPSIHSALNIAPAFRGEDGVDHQAYTPRTVN
jgi:hypothetical protein